MGKVQDAVLRVKLKHELNKIIYHQKMARVGMYRARNILRKAEPYEIDFPNANGVRQISNLNDSLTNQSDMLVGALVRARRIK